jgi:acetyl esterase/lipase
MPFTLDPELAAMAGGNRTGPVWDLPRGDAIALRNSINTAMEVVDAAQPESPDVRTASYTVPVEGGEILARWYMKEHSAPRSAVVYYHGGGMVGGSINVFDRVVAKYVQNTDVPFLSVDYRLAPEYPGTVLVDDGKAALAWFVARAEEFHVDSARIAVMGDSGGGGVAAGVAIAARDAGVAVAKQLLIYPMLDDRTVDPDPELDGLAPWSYDNNFTGWNAVLGESRGTEDVPARAAPARLTDFTGLAPAFIDVGELDIYRDECILYARNLTLAGVSTELYVRPGVPHGFDRINIEIARRSWADRYRAIQAI